jgi:hypothetical protein
MLAALRLEELGDGAGACACESGDVAARDRLVRTEMEGLFLQITRIDIRGAAGHSQARSCK